MDFTRSRNQNRPATRLAVPLRRERFPLIDLDELDAEADRALKRAASGAQPLQGTSPSPPAPSVVATVEHPPQPMATNLEPFDTGVSVPVVAQPESSVAEAHPEKQRAISRPLPRALPKKKAKAKA
jgi:hypothetical protein